MSPSRRDFLKTGAVAAAALAGPQILSASDHFGPIDERPGSLIATPTAEPFVIEFVPLRRGGGVAVGPARGTIRAFASHRFHLCPVVSRVPCPACGLAWRCDARTDLSNRFAPEGSLPRLADE